MIYTVALIVVAVVFALDPSLYAPYSSPKILLCIILPPLLLSGKYLNDFIKYRRSTITISLIEYLLMAQLIWIFLGNPRMLFNTSDVEFFLFVSLLLITFLTRQVQENKKIDSAHLEDENLKKSDKFVSFFLRAIWLIGICQAIIGLGQYYSFPKFLPIGTIKTPMIGTIGTANGYGSFLAVAFMALIVDYFSVQVKRYKIFRWIVGGILLTARAKRKQGSDTCHCRFFVSIYCFL